MHANSLSGQGAGHAGRRVHGPGTVRRLPLPGAEVVPDRKRAAGAGAGRAVIEAAGRIDVLVLNLAIPAPSTPVHQVSDGEWETTFAALVHPMREMVAAVLPQMIERKAGKILLMGSAAALRGMALRSSYAAARRATGLHPGGGRRGRGAWRPGQRHCAELSRTPPTSRPRSRPRRRSGDRLKWQVPLRAPGHGGTRTPALRSICAAGGELLRGAGVSGVRGWVSR